MPAADIRDLTAEQLKVSQLISADKEKKRLQQVSKAKAHTKEERHLISLQEAQVKKQRPHPRQAKYRKETVPKRPANNSPRPAYTPPLKSAYRSPYKSHNKSHKKSKERTIKHPMLHHQTHNW